MKIYNKYLLILSIFLFQIFEANSQELKQKNKYSPKLSGSILYQYQIDQIIDSQKKDIADGNGSLYIEPNFGLHFDENWSIKTQWRLQDNKTLTTRDDQNPERYRTFLSENRGFGLNKTGLLIEEIKLNYENEDMKFSIGKFDPNFGTAHRKSKRMGVFASQLLEDYNLREKIGANLTAVLEGGQISFSTFFNDTTDLSSSAIHDRKKEATNNGLSGNTGSFSSYSVSVEGENFLSIPNWFYNFGYRSLGINRFDRGRETGYVFGSEFLHKIGKDTSVIPLFEVARIENFSGEKKRTGNYLTLAIITKFSSWTAGTNVIFRNIRRSQNQNSLPKNSNDRQLQFFFGYKFTDNLTIDFSRVEFKENGYNAGGFGSSINYLYKF